jgi:tetratricopeptide (TPR) repeat protein
MSETPAELEHILLQAIKLYQQGRTAETGELCRNILKSAPDEPNALHLLGVVQLMNGDTASAAEYLTGAARIDAGNADILNNLATTLRKSGDAEQAEHFYQRAIALGGDSVKSLVNLANLYRGSGDLKAADAQYRKALEQDPDHYRALNNLGLTLEGLGEPVSALNMYQRAMGSRPGHPEPIHHVARLLGVLGEWQTSLDTFDMLVQMDPDDARYQTGRGTALAKLDRMVKAEAAFDLALVLSPGSVETLFRRAAALCDHDRPRDAYDTLSSAIKIAPDNADLHSLSGFALMRLGRMEEALIHLDRALLHDPDNADGWANRAEALGVLGRIELAIDAYDTALTHNPLHLDARYGRAITRLKRGRFTGGWRDYLARPSMRAATPELTRTPLPENLSGKQLTISGDPDISLDLFFMRFAPMLRARGAELSYMGVSQQRHLMSRAGLYSETVETDFILSVGDLPFLIGSEAAAGTVRAIPVPPLPNRVEVCKSRLQTIGPGPYVGVTWRGDADGPSLDTIALALSMTSSDIIVIQPGASRDEIEQFEAILGRSITDLTPPDGDLETLLALMGLLDEYVCVDNINIHLRAARGRPCRALIANRCAFYWMASGSRSAWFPETPLYRQAPDGAWETALSWLARDLAAAESALETQAG